MTACFFQLFRPDNIVFFVKTRLQLDENRHLLAIFCRLRQRCNDRRIAADTIKRLLDRKNIRIICCLTDQVDHRLERLIRMVKQNIPLFDRFKNIAFTDQLRNRLWSIRNIAKFIFSFQTVQLHEEGKIQRTIDLKHIFTCRIQLALQNI